MAHPPAPIPPDSRGVSVHPELTERAKRAADHAKRLVWSAESSMHPGPGPETENLARAYLELLAALIVSEQQQKRLRAALEELLDVAERARGGDPNLHPEAWYAARDFARIALSPSTPEENRE